MELEKKKKKANGKGRTIFRYSRAIFASGKWFSALSLSEYKDLKDRRMLGKEQSSWQAEKGKMGII